jgi:hypothetical protein
MSALEEIIRYCIHAGNITGQMAVQFRVLLLPHLDSYDESNIKNMPDEGGLFNGSYPNFPKNGQEVSSRLVAYQYLMPLLPAMKDFRVRPVPFVYLKYIKRSS